MATMEDRWSRRWPSHTAEMFVPSSFWTADGKGNYVLDIDTTGFKHEEVRIELASSDHLRIEGERIVDENKCMYIDQTFKIPENSDSENIVGKFEGERLRIAFPKKTAEKNKQEDSENTGNGNTINSTAEESSQEEETNKNHVNQTKLHDTKKKGEASNSPLEIAIKCIERNKGVVLSVVISFSIGVLVSKLWIN